MKNNFRSYYEYILPEKRAKISYYQKIFLEQVSQHYFQEFISYINDQKPVRNIDLSDSQLDILETILLINDLYDMNYSRFSKINNLSYDHFFIFLKENYIRDNFDIRDIAQYFFQKISLCIDDQNLINKLKIELMSEIPNFWRASFTVACYFVSHDLDQEAEIFLYSTINAMVNIQTNFVKNSKKSMQKIIKNDHKFRKCLKTEVETIIWEYIENVQNFLKNSFVKTYYTQDRLEKDFKKLLELYLKNRRIY